MKRRKGLVKRIIGVGMRRIKFKNSTSDDVKQAITRQDFKRLIVKREINIDKKKGISRGRAKKVAEQKNKGRRRGHGTRKGKKTARTPKKREWINKVRKQRSFLKELKEKQIINSENNKKVYGLIKGGFFRSQKHLKTYVNERGLVKDGKK